LDYSNIVLFDFEVLRFLFVFAQEGQGQQEGPTYYKVDIHSLCADAIATRRRPREAMLGHARPRPISEIVHSGC
jgi:hypothetical protein